ncbi:corrinoid protein [Candidatus Binatia bacterium]|nr:corrinoid protein [Candidatus Binatia bacterium]
MSVIDELQNAVETGNRLNAEALTRQALEAGEDAGNLIRQALIPAMAIVGEKFKNGEYFVPELLVASRAMRACLGILRPALVPGAFQTIGRVVIGTVRGDLHDIGKNLVKIMLEGAGFEVIDLGVDVAPERFVEAVRDHQPQIVGMSALLTTTMLSMPATIDALRTAALRDRVKVIVGGAPITDSFADEIAADGYGADAYAAVELAKRFIAA